MEPKKIGTRGEKILGGIKNLIKLARLAGYEIIWTPGRNGACLYWANKIEIGRGLSNTEKLVVLAHEIGHTFDYAQNKPDLQELVTLLEFWENYSHGERYFQREKSAWKYGKYLLEQIGVWPTVKSRFMGYRKKALAAYKKRLIAAREGGYHVPDPELYSVAMIKVKNKLEESGISNTAFAS